MYFLLTVESNKIVEVELLQDAEGVTKETNQYLYETDSDSVANALLNDYSKVTVSIRSGKVELGFDGTSEDVHVRRIAPENWITKVRPALMRAATTTHLFNN